MSYDDREALQILGQANRAQIQSDPVAKAKASDELREALATVARAAGFDVESTAGGCSIMTRATGKHVTVKSDPDEWAVIFTDANGQRNRHVLPIHFDPIALRWESDVNDKFICPTPGAPYPRRSALGVIAEAIKTVLFS